jgi:citronellol/citronellal dehydrogenase
MWGVNARATFACSQAAIPYLHKAANPHILTLSPPLNLAPEWFAPHLAYTLSKYGMSLCVLGLAAELKDDGVAVNALWPRTVIITSALVMLGMPIPAENCRKPEIMADAAHAILVRDSRAASGNFYIDDEVLRAAGVDDFDRYAVKPGEPLLPDLFLGQPLG